MLPAFRSRRHSISYLAALVIALLLPIFLSFTGYPPRSEVYKAVPLAAGPFAHITRQIFQETSDLDVVFVGSSLMWVGVNAKYFQEKLSQFLHRPARALMLGMNWPGLDLQYVLLRDLLEHRSVKMVVVNMPNFLVRSDEPHVQAYRWLRYGERMGDFQGLPLRHRISLYAMNVLGSPRHILSMLRPDQTAQVGREALLLGSIQDDLGWMGAPYKRVVRDPPSLPADQMIYSKSSEGRFAFDGAPLGPYQLHFAKNIAALLREKGVEMVTLQIPVERQRSESIVRERMFWPGVLGQEVRMIGIAPSQLFEGMNETEIRDLYYNDHFNTNGSEFFTRAITPAIVDLFEKVNRIRVQASMSH